MEDAEDKALKFGKRVDNEVSETEEYVSELRDKLTGWGFSPTLDKYVWDLISNSGYWVSPGGEEGAWTVEVRPKDDGKFDLVRAQEVLHSLDRELKFGHWEWSWSGSQLREDDHKVLKTLAMQLCSAATSSLEKHGDFRDAVKEMGDYALRGWSHPNASKRDDLRRMLDAYVRAREEYKDDVACYLAGKAPDPDRWGREPGGTDDFLERYVAERHQHMDWVDERVKQFKQVAAMYVDTSNAHTQWFTSEISASLLEPYMFVLGRSDNQLFPLSRIGAGRKEPWCIVIPLWISVLLFLLSVALVIGCYLLFTPMAAYGAAGLCGLVYARRYVQARQFRKERVRQTRLWHKVSDLHNEVENGKYNAGEVIRRFREIEADDLRLPSIFVSVIALREIT